jgi:hypothetical protein
MLWSTKLFHWKGGIIPTHDCVSRFYYETSPVDSKMENDYHETFILNQDLDKMMQNFSIFKQYLQQSTNTYVCSFPNINRSAILCVPMPRKNKNFTTMKDFIDNASVSQQKEFWKYVAIEIEEQLLHHKRLYISTHGHGVPYFHLRIEPVPKYYVTKDYIV